jgi:uncharacterized protein (DUF305 family)
MKHVTKLAAVGLAAALAVGVSACGSDQSTDGAAGSDQSSSTGTSAAADVAFAQAMIPHHEQAVEMADLALEPRSQASAEVQDLATQIKAAQGPEIEQMTLWLDGWDQPTAMPGAGSPHDMMGMDHDMGGLVVSGMMTGDDMAALAQLSGDAFDQAWLQMMIEHHKGAVAMAEQVAGSTLDPQVETLADAIIVGQRAEIATMQSLLP